jgi:hypothetical protein
MFSLREVHPQIYAWSFKSHTDLVLHFLRYQEYYENPDSDFRGQPFEMMEFIGHYAKKNKGNFTYFNDWGGFNVPDIVFEKIYKTLIPDFNSYDLMTKSVYVSLKRENKNRKFYLVGCLEGTKDGTLEHEIAHGLYYTNESYEQDVEDLIEEFKYNDYNVYENLENALLKNYYTEEVIEDEIQAYLSTGLSPFLVKPLGKHAKKIMKPFEQNFKKYTKK